MPHHLQRGNGVRQQNASINDAIARLEGAFESLKDTSIRLHRDLERLENEQKQLAALFNEENTANQVNRREAEINSARMQESIRNFGERLETLKDEIGSVSRNLDMQLIPINTWITNLDANKNKWGNIQVGVLTTVLGAAIMFGITQIGDGLGIGSHERQAPPTHSQP